MVKQTTRPYHGILLSNKNECVFGTCNNLDRSPKDYDKLKKKNCNQREVVPFRLHF